MLQKRMTWWLVLGGIHLALAATSVQAGIKLPAIIGENMVLQRGQSIPIWGWAAKGDFVTVTIADQKLTTRADGDGRWNVTLGKLKIGEPLEMIVKGSSGDEIKLKNILVGEVWVCSGQSNMEVGVKICDSAQIEIAAANYPQIRLFLVTNTKAAKPEVDVKARWAPCTPQSVSANEWPQPSIHGETGFSAVAYFFGRQLHKDLNVPVGLIDATWGGTPAEFWTSRKALEADPALKPLAQGESSCLYNGMIAPIIPYGIRGVIWYQGESNVGRAFEYRTLFPAMIRNWRAEWGQGGFPFGFVQLAPFRYPDLDPKCWAELCEAQTMTLQSVPNTGMAVTTDIGDVKDIHPQNKQAVGKRLALWAEAKVYGKDIVYSGPIYRSMTVVGNKIAVQFDHVGGGLVSRDGKPLRDFTIAGADQKFVPATVEIAGNRLIVSSPEVDEPVAVRFAWRDDSVPNLSNKEGLPASPFRTDSWTGVTEPDVVVPGNLLFENSDFEKGDLTNWTARGDAFNNAQPTKGDNTKARGTNSIRHQGEYWVGSYERYDGKTGKPGDFRGDSAVGTLESVEFIIDEPFVSFLVSGGRLIESESVALVIDGKEVKQATGDATERLRQVVWDVSSWKGKKAHIRILDKSKAPWGFIDADDFRYCTPYGSTAPTDPDSKSVPKWAVRDPYYPKYHLAPPGGWMNDPHPFYHIGAYHLFYQYSFRRDDPYSGGHSWGHILSTDLVHWKHMPVAITAAEAERHGRNGIWSGCVVDNGGVATAIYTVDNIDVWVSTSTDKDLATFQRDVNSPIIKGPPAGLEILDWTGFHDPWVWKEGDTWYMIIGCGAKDGSGPILPLYRSTDLVHWQYLHPLWESRGSPFYRKPYALDVAVECPTFFEMGGKHVLVLSDLSLYLVGRYEYHRFIPETSGQLDYYTSKARTKLGQYRPGPHSGFFVPQVTWDDKGRCLMWAWVLYGLDKEAQIKAGWAGSQTLPRVVTMGSEGLLNFEPAEEISALRRDHKEFSAFQLAADTSKVLDGVQGLQYEINATLEPGGATSFGIEFIDAAPSGKLIYNMTTKTLSFNDRSAPLDLKGGNLDLRLFIDAALIEVYANKKVCFSGVVRPISPAGFRVKLFAENGQATVRKVDVWTMGTLW